MGVDKLGVDEMGVDEMGSRRSGGDDTWKTVFKVSLTISHFMTISSQNIHFHMGYC